MCTCLLCTLRRNCALGRNRNSASGIGILWRRRAPSAGMTGCARRSCPGYSSVAGRCHLSCQLAHSQRCPSRRAPAMGSLMGSMFHPESARTSPASASVLPCMRGENCSFSLANLSTDQNFILHLKRWMPRRVCLSKQERWGRSYTPSLSMSLENQELGVEVPVELELHARRLMSDVLACRLYSTVGCLQGDPPFVARKRQVFLVCKLP